MKLKFKHQQFQSDAVAAVVQCFAGHPPALNKTAGCIEGCENRAIVVSQNEVLANIKRVQEQNGINVSDTLAGKYNLTIEMETGTGKTYTYIKTMFELNKTYGWNKFIIVVPSVAVREGVYKSLQITEDHFMNCYGRKPRFFIYNSRKLFQIENYVSTAGMSIMIINAQAFNVTTKDTRRMFTELDSFQSHRPIDLIARSKPILIIDEPQSVEGAKTKKALEFFNPLFTLRYSATHRQDYNKIYRLDAVDAFNKKLVKKIQVKGISVLHSGTAEGYLYLEGIEISRQKPPQARIELETRFGREIKRKYLRVKAGDNLYRLSGGLHQYQEFVVSEIDVYENKIRFANGVIMSCGEIRGQLHDLALRRIQIRETVLSHLAKEQFLAAQGIKVLSLFFIDEVAKYRRYDEAGQSLYGEYASIFEEEYIEILNDYLANSDDQVYLTYLQRIKIKDTHKGYFSIDKKTNRFINPKTAFREYESDDVDAYDLIIKDKERLLSLEEPTRFIFSHSALREGWDNPNVFQICTLKQSDSTMKKKQEVGRGLRLCVNMHGDRMDAGYPGIDVHDINRLTIVASESYEEFAAQLQAEYAEALSERSGKLAPKILVQDERKIRLGHAGRAGKGQTVKPAMPSQSSSINSEKLINICVQVLNQKLMVEEMHIIIKSGDMSSLESIENLAAGRAFRQNDEQDRMVLSHVLTPQRYDLVDRLVRETKLTRKTVIRILTGISPEKFALFKRSPEQFIINTARLINEKLMLMISLPRRN